MELVDTALPEVKLLRPRVFGDGRGYFFEAYNARVMNELLGHEFRFVQDNQSRSQKGVLRGLHYQIRQPQGKLVRVLAGEIFDVAVDLRRSAPTFGQWCGVRLGAASHEQLWVPEGFGHGFLVLSDFAEVLYKTTDYYAPEHERTIIWDDKDLSIQWPHSVSPALSEKDRQGVPFAQAECYP